MKNTYLYLLLVILMTSCLAIKAPLVYTGMTISQFIDVAKHEELVSMEGNLTVYRVMYGFSGEETRFYYFRNNVLVSINEGERKTDLRIKVDN